MSGTVVRGMTGIGKTVLVASCIADADVLRYYSDGVAWLKFDCKPQRDNWSGIRTNSRYITTNSADANNVSPLKETSLTLVNYIAYLDDLANQLHLYDNDEAFTSFISSMQTLSCTKPSKNIHTEYQKMIIAKNKMSYRLKNLRVIIVLDGIWWRNDPSWFDFSFLEYGIKCSNVHLLITTRNRNIVPYDHNDVIMFQATSLA